MENTTLSPEAQAVLDAASPAYYDADFYFATGKQHAGKIAAAAIRAAVDQAIPMTKTPWGSTLVSVLTAQESRERILAIADELEAL